MLDDTLPSLILIRVAILILQSIGPCSCAYTIFWIWSNSTGLHGCQSLWLQGVQLYAIAEACFYVFLLFYTMYIQREAVHPPLRTKAEREAIFTKIYSELHDTEQFLSGWFKGARIEDIGHENLKSFLDWVFWEGRATTEDNEELEAYIKKIEDAIGKRFKTGKGSAQGLRLTLDPIEIASRPLAWYMLLMLVETFGFFRMRYYGFTYYRTAFFKPLIFPPRPGMLLPSKRSPSRKLSYWYRPHTSKTRPPVLFIHGIGIGLHPHIDFFHELDRHLNGAQSTASDGTIGILALEILPISSRITSPILRRSEFIAHVTTVLDAHSIDKFVLTSHSYGSIFSTYILTYDPLASRVTATVLMDPVTILLHMPDVAYNFTVRQPSNSASQWQLWWFASKDPGVAQTLGRHFFWYENCLWRDQILKLVHDGMRFTVSLASDDLIVDATAVAKYLLQDDIPDHVVTKEGGQERMKLEMGGYVDEGAPWKTRPWRGEGLDVMWWEGLNHAQVFDSHEPTAKLAHVVAQYCLQR